MSEDEEIEWKCSSCGFANTIVDNERVAEFTKIYIEHCNEILHGIDEMGVDRNNLEEVAHIATSIDPLKGEDAFLKGWRIFLIYLKESFGTLEAGLGSVDHFLSDGMKKVAFGLERMDFKDDSKIIARNVCRNCGTRRDGMGRKYGLLYYSLVKEN